MTEIRIAISKADDMAGRVTPNAHIEIAGKLVITWTTLAEWDLYADAEAKRLENVLVDSLPGGVYDRLLGRMLSRKASHFRVAHVTEAAE